MGFVGHGKDSPQWRGGKSTTSNGRYETTFLPEHYRADVRGYVLTHILIAEKALGKPIQVPIEVHHHDESQLVICQDKLYHHLLHRRMNALKSCGNVHWHKCYICKKYDAIENLKKRKTENTFYHMPCKDKANRESYAKKHDGNVRSWERGRKCTVAGCENPHASRGFCMIHYCRFRRNGTLFNNGDVLDLESGEIFVESK